MGAQVADTEKWSGQGQMSGRPQARRKVRPWQLFRFARGADLIALVIAIPTAILQGACMPFFAEIFGDSISAVNTTSVVDAMQKPLVMMGILCVAMFVTMAIWQTALVWASERQCARMRVEYLRSVLSQDLEWFDRTDPATLPANIATDVQMINNAIGMKTGMLVMICSQFVFGVGLAFYKGWELTLVILAAIPFMAVLGPLFAVSMKEAVSLKQDWFGKASAVAEEAIGSIRTVAAFGGEAREIERFQGRLGVAKNGGVKAGLRLGFVMGSMFGMFACLYGAAFIFGGHELIAKMKTNSQTGEPYTGADVISVFFAVVIGVSSLMQIGDPLNCYLQGIAGAERFFAVIDCKPNIESDSEKSEDFPQCANTLATLEFKQVSFSYPARPEIQILNGLDLTIKRGQKVALVGESGSGKSTVVQLLERFYDPIAGVVLVNGIPLRELPVHAWRRQIGYVGQEPVLFATTVAENIRAGDARITQAQVEEAAQQAQAYEFVSALPEKFETFVGVGGGQISGGQKQRIAIARALAKKPQMLLLDEATSALDTESEQMVQATIDMLQTSAEHGLATLSIAHRLTTVRNSDVIFVLRRGVVVEHGTHFDLMAMEGEYYTLVTSQEISADQGANVASDSQCITATGLQSPLPLSDESKDRTTVIRADGSPPIPLANATSSRDVEKQRAKALDKSYKTPTGRLFRLSKPEWWLFPLALLGASLSGAAMPAQGLLFTEGMRALYILPVEDMKDEVTIVSCLFFALAAGILIGEFLKFSLFTYIQECLILRLRGLAFTSVMRQSVGFFDDPGSSPAGITATLARQTVMIAQATGVGLGGSVGALMALVFGLVLSFVGSWKLALAMLVIMPLVIATQGVMMKVFMSADTEEDGSRFSVSSEIASEAILNIRTVRALSAGPHTLRLYESAVQRVASEASRNAPRNGFIVGLGQGIMFLPYVAAFAIGARLVEDDGLEGHKMFQALFCLMFGVMGIGLAMVFAPDAALGRLAAHDVFKLVDRRSDIDAVTPDGTHRTLGDGCVLFENVRFTFPHRQELEVLKGVTFAVSPGQAVALVGPSGSGKSTVIQLLLRFYDPSAGTVKVGGVDLRKFDIAWWRRQVGFVGQEPILFNTSLEENVKYGKPEATREEVEAAAKLANMDYVFNKSVGWEDCVGVKGERLSGGQKQRCAIARAVLRNPSVLLLDEATSALDTQSERIVQEALDAARRGRTTFTIAHRLSTIRESDLIFVVAEGQILERGAHEELISANGLYSRLAGVRADL